MIENSTIDPTAEIKHPELCNIYECEIGAYSAVGPFVEIQRGVVIGRLCKIESHSFVCNHVTLGDRVFVGHGVMFTNDRYPVILSDVKFEETAVCDGASIGSGAVIGPGVCIGNHSIIGAGAVVINDVPAYSIVAGNPATVIRQFKNLRERNQYLEKHYDSFSDAGRGRVFQPISATG